MSFEFIAGTVIYCLISFWISKQYIKKQSLKLSWALLGSQVAIGSFVLIYFLWHHIANFFLDKESGWTGLIIILGIFVCMFLGMFVGSLFTAWFGSGNQRGTHGSARFGTFKDAEKGGHLVDMIDDNFFLATMKKEKMFVVDKHVLTVAPTGSGKSVSAVIPNLLTFYGSALVIDVKGENYYVTNRCRRKFSNVYLIDPFKVIEGGETSSVNLLDRIDPADENVVNEAGALADMIIIPSKDSDQYWNDATKELLVGLIIYVASLEDEERRNIGEVRRLLSSGENVLEEALLAMVDNPKLGFNIPTRAANNFLSKADKDRSGVLSSAGQHTSFLDDPRIAMSLSKSGCDFRKIKEEKMTVYLVMPPDKITGYNRFIRAMIGQTISAVTSSATGITQSSGSPIKVAFFLDEFTQLGYMPYLETNISSMLGYGARFWVFLQDLSQIKAVYPKWQSFMANSVKQFFGTSDFDTAKYISDMMGQYTISFKTRSTGSSSQMMKGGGSSSENIGETVTGRNLLNPDEVMGLDKDSQLIFIAGEHPYHLVKYNYLKDVSMVEKIADKNPYYQEAQPQVV